MSVDGKVIGWIRAHERYPVEIQRAALVADIVYVQGRKEGRNDLIRALRPGDIAETYYLFLLADPAPYHKRDRFVDMMNVVAEIEAAGAMLWEAATGHLMEDAAWRRHMTERALAMIEAGGRGGERAKAGRPAIVFSADHLAIMQEEWFSLRNKTNDDALAAAQARGVPVSSTWMMWKQLRASGRAERWRRR